MSASILPISEQVQSHYQSLAQSAASEADAEQFFGRFLAIVMSLVPEAEAGAVWVVTSPGSAPQLICHKNLTPSWIDGQSLDARQFSALVQQALSQPRPVVLPAANLDQPPAAISHPFSVHMICVPVLRDHRVLGLVQLVLPPHALLNQQQQQLQIIGRFAPLVGQWLATKSLKRVQQQGNYLLQVDRFAKEIHTSLDLRQTCYSIVNEARLLLKCDRVSLLTTDGRKSQLIAVSGQATIDRRATLVRKLSELAQAVLVSGESLCYDGQPLDLPPQIERLLDEYLDESFARGLIVIPLSNVSEKDPAQNQGLIVEESRHAIEPAVIGALVIEQIEGEQAIAEIRQSSQAIHEHVRSAVANAADYNSLPFLPLVRFAANTKALFHARNLPKTLLFGGLFALCALVLCFWPAQLRIRAAGSLQPIERRDVFVDVPGTVSKVLVAHGDHVEVGDVLVELENSDLEVQLAEVRGQLQEAQQRALAAEKKMVDTLLDSEERHSLASERLTLTRRVESLEIQSRLLEEKRKRLTVRSTASGSVVSWDAEQRLMNKPVVQGEVLMSVANLDGPWELDLFVPERRIGHVVQARQNATESMNVDFILRTDPGTQIPGTVREIHASAELQEVEGLGVRVKVDFPEQDVNELYPGAAVAAELDCGRHVLGYVWFHEVFEWIYTHIFF